MKRFPWRFLWAADSNLPGKFFRFADRGWCVHATFFNIDAELKLHRYDELLLVR